MSSEKPLVYLILGAAGSGRREIVADLIDGGLAAGSAGQQSALALLPADEVLKRLRQLDTVAFSLLPHGLPGWRETLNLPLAFKNLDLTAGDLGSLEREMTVWLGRDWRTLVACQAQRAKSASQTPSTARRGSLPAPESAATGSLPSGAGLIRCGSTTSEMTSAATIPVME